MRGQNVLKSVSYSLPDDMTKSSTAISIPCIVAIDLNELHKSGSGRTVGYKVMSASQNNIAIGA